MVPHAFAECKKDTKEGEGYEGGRRIRRSLLLFFVRLSLLVRVVRATHEWARLDVAEAHLEADTLELGELGRRVVALHRQVSRGRAQVLADGDYGDTGVAEILQRG